MSVPLAAAIGARTAPIEAYTNSRFVILVRNWLKEPTARFAAWDQAVHGPLGEALRRPKTIMLHLDFVDNYLENARIYRAEPLRRLGKKGDPVIDNRYRQFDPKTPSPERMDAKDSNPWMIKDILDDLEKLTNELDAVSH